MYRNSMLSEEQEVISQINAMRENVKNPKDFACSHEYLKSFFQLLFIKKKNKECLWIIDTMNTNIYRADRVKRHTTFLWSSFTFHMFLLFQFISFKISVRESVSLRGLFLFLFFARFKVEFLFKHLEAKWFLSFSASLSEDTIYNKDTEVQNDICNDLNFCGL